MEIKCSLTILGHDMKTIFTPVDDSKYVSYVCSHDTVTVYVRFDRLLCNQE